jgi:hypothetical protein
MDPFTPQWSADNIWLVGTRVRPMKDLPEALAAKPPYIVTQTFDETAQPDPSVYDLVVDRPGLRLYRRRELAGTVAAPVATATPPSGSAP